MFKRSTAAQEKRERKLRAQALLLESQLEARDRTIEVLKVEIETLALVIARDRERVKAEAAKFASDRARCEAQNG